MDIHRIPRPNPALDAVESRLREDLATLEAEFRSRAQPYIDRLAEIESLRDYAVFAVPDLNERFEMRRLFWQSQD